MTTYVRRFAGMTLAGLLLFGIGAPACAADVAMFRGDAAHTGVYHTAAIAHFNKVKWKFKTGGYVLSSPAVADGGVYFGSTDGNIYALDAGSGKLRWKHQTDSRVTSSPAVADGIVYASSFDGYIYALDAGSGTVRWKFKTGGERRYAGTHLHGFTPVDERMPDPFDLYLSSPAVADQTVYAGSGDGNVYALDARTGDVRWKFKTGDVVHASPAIANGTVYVGSWDRYFYALDAATGHLRWRFLTGDDRAIHNQIGIQSSAAVGGGLVYFGCRDSHLYALDAASGQLRWSIPTHGSWVIASPALRAHDLYFATSDSGLFYDVDATTGAVRFKLDFKGWPTFSSPAIAGRMVYVGSHVGLLRAIDLDRKSVAWTFETDGHKRNGAKYTSADGTPNYALAFRGDFYDDLVIGADEMMSVGAIYSSPIIDNGVIYFGSTDGNLYAIE